MTEAERAALEAIAHARGVTLADVLRAAIYGSTDMVPASTQRSAQSVAPRLRA